MQARRCGTASVADAPRVCTQTGVVACAVHAHIFWLSDQKFRVSRPLAAAPRDSSSACLITLTARACIPLWRPNLRVNWNRKLEQMLFWQNPFRKPFFQFLTDFEKLPVFLFQCRPTSKPSKHVRLARARTPTRSPRRSGDRRLGAVQIFV